MSSTGAGYDYSCGTFSPDGRIFQVEYAQKAVENSGTAIGIKCSDGIVIAVEKPMVSKMLVKGSNRRSFGIDSHMGAVVTGVSADGRQLINRAREEAHSYSEIYGCKMVPSVLANRLGLFMHYYTIYGALRPFGSTALIAAYDEDIKTPELYMIEPSGVCFRYFGCAAGKGAQAAKTELEKLITKNGVAGMSCEEAVKELAKIIYTIRDASRDKPFEIEMGWLCDASNFKYAAVPADLLKQADEEGKAAVVGNPVAPPAVVEETAAPVEQEGEPMEEGAVEEEDPSTMIMGED